MNARKLLKSLFEATGMAATPKMASFRVLKTKKRFVKHSPKPPPPLPPIGQSLSTTY